MKPMQRTKRIIITAFLLSLLFHASSILFITIQKSQTSSLQDTDDLLKKELTKKDQWAETKARASNFGAPIFFKDLPDMEESSEETTAQEPIEEIQETVTEHETPTITQSVEATQIITPQKSVQKKRTHRKRNNTHHKKPQPQQTQKKPPLTLAQLTQGFLHHLKDEGNHKIHMLGKKNALPSDEQIKYEQYLQKISWNLQNSFNIHNDRFPSAAPADTNAHIFLALNKDGSLKQVALLQSSGDRQVDNFVLFIFRDASESFPPVPQYLPHNPFTVNYVVAINTNDNQNIRMYRK